MEETEVEAARVFYRKAAAVFPYCAFLYLS
jgi:hypothetical protein